VRIAALIVFCFGLLTTGISAKEEYYQTEDGQIVVVRTEERSSGRGWGKLGILALLLIFGGAAAASQRKFTRPKNRVRSGTTATGIQKSTRPASRTTTMTRSGSTSRKTNPFRSR
jgi:hypothetical protein